MKSFKTFVFLGFFLFATQALAEPLIGAECVAGGEYGNQVTIELSGDYQFGGLTVYRKKSGTNYKRDMSQFKGGRYRLDLASHGGITGFEVTYKQNEASEFQTLTGDLNCTATVVAPSEPKTEISKPLEEVATESPEKAPIKKGSYDF